MLDDDVFVTATADGRGRLHVTVYAYRSPVACGKVGVAVIGVAAPTSFVDNYR